MKRGVVAASLALSLMATPAVGGGSRPFLWERLADADLARTEVAAAATGDGRIVVAGGFDPGGTTSEVEIYDPRSDSWAPGPPLPVPVNHAMAASSGGEVFVFGGYTSSGEPSNQALVLRNGSWEALPPMPEPRAAGGAAAAGAGLGAERIYVVGGIGASGLATTTLVLDPDSETWGFAPGLAHPREHLGVAGSDVSVYAIGGRTVAEGNLATAEELYIPEGGWRPMNDLPTARSGLGAASTANGFVLAVGGEGARIFDEVEAWWRFGTGGHWMRLPPMPSGRHGLGVVAVGNIVYALHGGPQPGLAFSARAEATRVKGFFSLWCDVPATVVGSPRRDVIEGGPGRDVLVGLGGADTLVGDGASDRLCGQTGDDRLRGGAGNDRLWGGSGDDVLDGGGGRDPLAGGRGIDRCDVRRTVRARSCELSRPG